LYLNSNIAQKFVLVICPKLFKSDKSRLKKREISISVKVRDQKDPETQITKIHFEREEK